MVQTSDENCKPFFSMVSGRVRKIPPPSPPLSKDKGLKDIGDIMSIGNLILGVNSVTYVTVSYLIHYDSLLQNASGFSLQNATVLLLNATVITKWDAYYKLQQYTHLLIH